MTVTGKPSKKNAVPTNSIFFLLYTYFKAVKGIERMHTPLHHLLF